MMLFDFVMTHVFFLQNEPALVMEPSGRAPLKEMLHIESLIHGQET